jgi:hypothetical protein
MGSLERELSRSDEISGTGLFSTFSRTTPRAEGSKSGKWRPGNGQLARKGEGESVGEWNLSLYRAQFYWN